MCHMSPFRLKYNKKTKDSCKREEKKTTYHIVVDQYHITLIPQRHTNSTLNNNVQTTWPLFNKRPLGHFLTKTYVDKVN